ncbi:MAG TPA: bifunctional 5,10-methylenetetrahydrofolate dehydrogenase/5,10-methenyltetrahydrofolate cyclohydrolase [Candidatus Saccharimonadales bacterium]|nr:bifunctional 5,10-methylenetetrahydrofolate dehydrogenase/5,10-methenyltetrahydrofolate cyclohydrolase [Candidatus Saccharimonadales bacterium]
MTGKIIDGRQIAGSILDRLRIEVSDVKARGAVPKLVVIQVGDDPASTIYVNRKSKTCLSLGMDSEVKRFPVGITCEELVSEIERLNSDRKVHGILVQLPLPAGIDHKRILETVDPRKDVDGLNPYNQGKNLLGEECFQPATPRGIVTLLESTGEKLEGKSVVIIGRSNIVGKPTAVMLLKKGCTVTVCHSKTRNLPGFTRGADILVSAVGKPKLVRAEMIREGAIVIDVGITRLEDGKIVGDVDFDEAIKKASWITPVPKGVGPMTIASLMENTMMACRDIEWPQK